MKGLFIFFAIILSLNCYADRAVVTNSGQSIYIENQYDNDDEIDEEEEVDDEEDDDEGDDEDDADYDDGQYDNINIQLSD